MMWFVPGAQWKKSHAFRRRSSPSTIEDALAGEDEEVLLDVLRVVLAVGLAGREDVDADAVVLEAVGRLEVGPVPARPLLHPAGVGEVEDEPAGRRGVRAVARTARSWLLRSRRDPTRGVRPRAARGRGRRPSGSTGGGAPSRRLCATPCVERRVVARHGRDGRARSSAPSRPQRSGGSSPQPGSSGVRPARSASSCGSAPCLTNAARSPRTRKRGPGWAATRLIQRCDRSPEACSSARKTSSSTSAPARRRVDLRVHAARPGRRAAAPGRRGACRGRAAARPPRLGSLAPGSA